MLLADVGEGCLCQGFVKGPRKFAAQHVKATGSSIKKLTVPNVVALARSTDDKCDGNSNNKKKGEIQ